jgi:hypothetical protein
MSPSIWTRCAGKSNARKLRLEPWRAVEAQHTNSTRKLVDRDEEQQLLEELIDGAKGPAPSGKRFERLHYLLYTPFRYPPLLHGSRFGRRTERGIWYGSRRPDTALAETAYYRLLFLEGTTADLGPVSTRHAVFQARVSTRAGVDLTSPPFDAFAERLASPNSYADTQPLGTAMRDDGIEAVLYTSARDPGHGQNMAIFEPCFTRTEPSVPVAWACTATREAVELRKDDVFRSERLRFERGTFLVKGKLPAPGVG